MSSDDTLTWEVEVPLLTNPYVTGAWLKAMFWTYVAAVLLLGVVLVATGEAEGVPALAGIFALGVGAVAVLGLLIMPLWFGRSFRARFTLSDTSLVYEGIDERARAAARLAVLAGAREGGLATTGAGLGAMSREVEALEWDGAFFMVPVPARHLLVFKNAWRDLMHVYCTPENYPPVLERVQRHMAENGTAERLQRVKGRSPIPGALAETAAVVAACLPIFAMVDMVDLHLLVPIVILVFGVATVWMIPILAFPLFPALAWVLFTLGAELLGTSEITLVNTYRFRGYEGMDTGDWVLVGLLLAGVAYLAWFSFRAVTGRFLSVLIQDREGMGQ